MYSKLFLLITLSLFLLHTANLSGRNTSKYDVESKSSGGQDASSQNPKLHSEANDHLGLVLLQDQPHQHSSNHPDDDGRTHHFHIRQSKRRIAYKIVLLLAHLGFLIGSYLHVTS